MVASYAKIFAAVCGLASTAAAVNPVTVQGKDFVDTVTGDRFQIVGVDYQPGGSSAFKGTADPLSDKDSCLRDAAILQYLGINTIRVYNLAPSANHDECASIFNAAGIYMILDVNSPLDNGSLNRGAPWESYNPIYMAQVFGVIEAFKNYPNTAGFFSGNEVINEDSVELVPNYIRAVQRDMHDYISKNSNRSIPVGYSAADVRPLLVDTAYYLSCNLSNSTNSRSDFFGLNSYSWCGDATYHSSGYDVLTQDFANISMPVFFSETGCNNVKPRVFSEIQAIYGPDMSQALSGALVYEYSQEANDYGLVSINSNGSVTLLIDFENLKSQYNKLDFGSITAHNSSQTSIKAPTCDPKQITSNITKSFDVPDRVAGIDKMIQNGVTTNVSVGALVSVSSTKISQTVYDYKGNVVSGIQLNVLDKGAVNTPSNSSTVTSSSPSGTSTGTSASASSTGKGAASSVRVNALTGLGAMAAVAFFAL
ncbi:1,3-beta-glucanosyltransferase Gel2 [Talaromyces stipitatus ATCC 10500]|uniref:1,3-beta-glucanosyltransferase n=1 Tax=Talaromyces stipitatus (strain ATCC 10500 / CBS 375.48 / QM 6759 / NRRL 1006) TaxID=441959 RepID=B8MEP1_TALSN|nr:1,3-beta-glucanosyltransferase Gel2 [Talaromyces stipitatus ATCC 10500]EED16924.1 1,3-beta-glucanosyltransferase Gel2 [Talaromyces stipitatus ATCC 10500]